jgi:hypothetical protein
MGRILTFKGKDYMESKDVWILSNILILHSNKRWDNVFNRI